MTHTAHRPATFWRRLACQVALATTVLSTGVLAHAQKYTGPSTTTPPYFNPTTEGVATVSILTTKYLTTDFQANGYYMSGVPDGLGAFPIGDGSFLLLMNHEIAKNLGATRAHGGTGAFVSEWQINGAGTASPFQVRSGADLMREVYLWDIAANNWVLTPNVSFGRFCSADLAPVEGTYNPATGRGTTNRIFLNGEEEGLGFAGPVPTGRAMAHMVTGPDANKSYELARMGNLNWENLLVRPMASDTTVLIGNDDTTSEVFATPPPNPPIGEDIYGGLVTVYIGTKQSTGNDVQKAGLQNGKLYAIRVPSFTGNAEPIAAPAGPIRFTYGALGNLGDATTLDLANTYNSAKLVSATRFARPEDGVWDPVDPKIFYFHTTGATLRLPGGSEQGVRPCRLWRLKFDDANNVLAGGTIELLITGTETDNTDTPKKLDNMTMDRHGRLFLTEDAGNSPHLGRVFAYDAADRFLTPIAQADPARFTNDTAPNLTDDEEGSGIIDAEDILGRGWTMLDMQVHPPSGVPVDPRWTEGGQLLAIFTPTANFRPLTMKAGRDGFLYILWESEINGTALVWKVDAAGGYNGSYLIPALDGFKVKDIAPASQGEVAVLREGPSGVAAISRVGSLSADLGTTFYGPYITFNPVAIEAGEDLSYRLLWKTAAGAAAVWNLNSNLGIERTGVLGPFTGFQPKDVELEANGNTVVAFEGGNGSLVFRRLGADLAQTGTATFGPFTGLFPVAVNRPTAVTDAANFQVEFRSLFGASSVTPVSSTLTSGTAASVGPFRGYRTAGVASFDPANVYRLYRGLNGKTLLFRNGTVIATYGPY